MVLDPRNPDVLYATSEQRRRHVKALGATGHALAASDRPVPDVTTSRM